MSTTFDYIRAWHDIARPAYDVLPADVRQLFLDTARIAADLRQGPDCAMIWPNEEMYATVDGAEQFRGRFDKIPAEWLALAAQVVECLGHWKPGPDDTLPEAALPAEELAAIGAGAHWKFSHYADQSLRVRLSLPERGSKQHFDRGGSHFEVHEGAIRLCYSSRHCWTWREVAPATIEGLEYATALHRKLAAKLATINRTHIRNRDQAAYEFMRPLEENDDRPNWPESWRPFVQVAKRYMVERGQEGIPSLVYAKATKRMEIKIAKMPAEYEAAIEKYGKRKRLELAGRLWWLERGIDDDNLIYYDHTLTFSFGWREPVSWDLASKILEHAAEFPYRYEIKVAPCTLYPQGTKLEGGQS